MQAQVKPFIAAREALARLEELPAAARVVRAALKEIADVRCTSGRLEEILGADPATTADVLRLANSAYYGARSEVRTLALAVTLIGQRRLAAVLRHLLAGKLLRKLAGAGEGGKRARNVALAAAVICRGVAQFHPTADGEEMMVAGLVHNAGELALLTELPDSYARVLELVAENTKKSKAESEVLGINSFEATEILLRAWDFPEVYIQAARHWGVTEWPSAAASTSVYIGFVHIGAHIANAWVDGLKESKAIDLISESATQLTGVYPHLLTGIYGEVEAGVEHLEHHL